MRLAELDPRWILRDGARVALAFRCPHCRKVWLTCTFVALKLGEQLKLTDEQIPDGSGDVVPCKALAWKLAPGQKIETASFDSLTVKPSLNAGASGHWHGHITAGKIDGGI